MKRCRVCGVDKDLSMFYARKGSSDGHRSDCKACCIAKASILQRTPERAAYRRRHYVKNCEAVKAASRAYASEHRDDLRQTKRAWYRRNAAAQRPKKSASAKRRYDLNPDKGRAKQRETMRRRRLNRPADVAAAKLRDYNKHTAKRLATVKAWRVANPDRVAANALKSRARRRSRMADVFIETVVPRRVFERDGWLCGICGINVEKKDASLDHIIPISKGGAHSYANTQTSHLRCNISKGARTERVA